jgi:ribokinase
MHPPFRSARNFIVTGRKPIVVVGSINLDLVTFADHMPVAGETVPGRNFRMIPGGKGANQAVAVARLGYPVEMIGKIGDDFAGEQLREHMERAGIGLEGVEKTRGASGTAVIIVAPNGENCIVVTPGANAQVTPEYVDQQLDLIRSAGLVLAQLEIPLDTVEHLALLCSQYGIPFILDPAPARKLPPELLGKVRWFTPNEMEAAFYIRDLTSGEAPSEPQLTAHSILDHGPAGVILKLGPRGAYLASNGTGQMVPAARVTALDSTAAGDAFNGAFAVGLMSGWNAIESAGFAVAAASLSFTRPGAQTSMPNMAEVTEMLRRTQQL